MSVESEQQLAVLRWFVAACEQDERVVAAFLGGSLAAGSADEWSDLDIYLITTDEAYEDFLHDRKAFIRRMGEPLFLEDFDSPYTLFFVFAGGTEGELGCGCESRFLDMHKGPHKVLLDKKGILAGIVFSGYQPAQHEQVEILRRQVYWFWHDLSHFVVAMGRGQLWWAQGQLEVLRRCCVSLARLRQDAADTDGVEDPYFKVEVAIPASDLALAPLQATICPMEPGAMLRSALAIIAFYQELAHLLVERHGVSYPADLEHVMLTRLERLRRAIG
ncbi:MAG: aminoglycoside 6-adenylyltransferase [Chloroflexia bacterium]